MYQRKKLIITSIFVRISSTIRSSHPEMFCSSEIAQQRVCFPVNFRKKFKTAFLQNPSRQLLPNNVGSTKKRINDWRKED